MIPTEYAASDIGPLFAGKDFFSGKTAIKIYMLVDPRTKQVRYVGKTEKKLEARLSAHMRDTSNCHRVHWLNQLKALGLAPHIVMLEEISGEWPWQESERYWIARLKAQGAKLTNNTSGGDGVPDLPPAKREKIRLASVGRKHTPAALEKLRAARARRVITPQTREKTRRAMLGRRITWVDKLRVAVSKFTPEKVEEISSRLAAGEGVQALALKYHVHRTTISKIKAGTYFQTSAENLRRIEVECEERKHDLISGVK